MTGSAVLPSPGSLQPPEPYRFLYEQNPSLVFTVAADGTILTVNEFGAGQLGYRPEELVGRSLHDLAPAEYQEPSRAALQAWLREPDRVHRWELPARHRDGSVLWMSETTRIVTGPDGARQILICREDITELRRRSEQLSYLATHDSLTHLINRGEFERRLAKLLRSAVREHHRHALCYLDLDDFESINEDCGHAAGDEALRQLGLLLREQIRNRDTLARLGGDEFGILMEHCPVHIAEQVAGKLLQVIADFRFTWGERIFRIGVSIGIVPLDGATENLSEILEHADRACHVAHSGGRNRIHVFGARNGGFSARHGDIRGYAQIRKALDGNGFRLNFHPIVPLQAGAADVEQYEVLVRMRTRAGKLAMPDTFLPAAEHYNLAPEIDRWVINALFDQLSRLPPGRRHGIRFSVNLSGQSLGGEELYEFILGRLAATDIKPGQLCFEITETVAIANLAAALRFISNLRSRGCRFALDDFGSGLSSFAYLKNLQVDFLKIDGGFIRDLATNPMSLAIVKSMHEIAQVTGKRTVAEYVTDRATCELLRGIGIDYGQGDYFGTARSFAQIRRRLPSADSHASSTAAARPDPV